MSIVKENSIELGAGGSKMDAPVVASYNFSFFFNKQLISHHEKLIQQKRFSLVSVIDILAYEYRLRFDDVFKFNGISLSQKLNEAASLIQSVYRGYMTRKSLRKASAAIGKFQRIYKKNKQRQEEERIRKLESKERESLEQTKRRNEFLSSRTKQLKV